MIVKRLSEWSRRPKTMRAAGPSPAWRRSKPTPSPRYAAAAVLERVLAGDIEPGFQTPGRVYGSDFVLGIPGTQREDLV
jgi:hypothetical protein